MKQTNATHDGRLLQNTHHTIGSYCHDRDGKNGNTGSTVISVYIPVYHS